MTHDKINNIKTMNKPTRVFDFVLRNGKISPEISGVTAHYFFATHWIPLEMYINEVKENLEDMSPAERMALIAHDLKEWHKEWKPIEEYAKK